VREKRGRFTKVKKMHCFLWERGIRLKTKSNVRLHFITETKNAHLKGRKVNEEGTKSFHH